MLSNWIQHLGIKWPEGDDMLIWNIFIDKNNMNAENSLINN